MNSPKLLHTLKLANGLTVSIYDQTNVYFGDYHHIRINVVCSCAATADDLSSSSPVMIEQRSIIYTRSLEKMGVPSEDVERVTKALLNDFHQNALPYISSEEFPKKIIKNELSKIKHSVRKYAGAGY